MPAAAPRPWSDVSRDIVAELSRVPESELFARAAAAWVFDGARGRRGLFVTRRSDGKRVALRKAFATKAILFESFESGDHPYAPLAWLPLTLLSEVDAGAAVPLALAAVEADPPAPPGVRSNAAAILAASRDDQALRALLTLLDAEDPASRHVAACKHPGAARALAERLKPVLAAYATNRSEAAGNKIDRLVALLWRIGGKEALTHATELGLMGPRPTYGAALAAVALDRATAFDRLAPYVAPERLATQEGEARAVAILTCLTQNDLDEPRLLSDRRWYDAALAIVRSGRLLNTGYVFEALAEESGGRVPEEALRALVDLAGKVPDGDLQVWLVHRLGRSKKELSASSTSAEAPAQGTARFPRLRRRCAGEPESPHQEAKSLAGARPRRDSDPASERDVRHN